MGLKAQVVSRRLIGRHRLLVLNSAVSGHFTGANLQGGDGVRTGATAQPCELAVGRTAGVLVGEGSFTVSESRREVFVGGHNYPMVIRQLGTCLLSRSSHLRRLPQG